MIHFYFFFYFLFFYFLLFIIKIKLLMITIRLCAILNSIGPFQILNYSNFDLKTFINMRKKIRNSYFF